MKMFKRVFTFLLFAALTISTAIAQQVKGSVKDAETGESLIGATIEVDGTNVKAVTDVDGNFILKGLRANATYVLTVNYLGYKTNKVGGVKASDGVSVEVKMHSDDHQLNEVSVTAVQRRNTDAAMIQMAKASTVIVSNVSAQEISRTQDSNAGEVIRRVPGVSLIEDKFVMVRGLSQRYNNVWINGGAVPSSEADSRAFSFDIIPSSQIDNLTIVKSPSAQYPADYSGGFIIVNTKEIPSENGLSLSVGGSWNDATVFKDFSYSKGSSTDFLGFDGGLRSLKGGIESTLNTNSANGIDLLNNDLNNDWMVKSKKPLGDLKLAASLNRGWNVGGRQLGLLAAMNYTSEYRTYTDMQNNLFGVYDVENDHSNYLRHSVDDQYNRNVRVGGMLNLTILSKNGNHKYQFKNIVNQLGNSRYTWREGVSAQANLEKSAEYYYRSRTTYNGQLTGKHTLKNDVFDWNLGYAYANRHLPDRRRYLIDDALEDNVFALSTGNDVSREWTQLDEHIFSVGVNEKHDFHFGNINPSLLVGGYGEYRTRKYFTRNFYYNWNKYQNSMPKNFQYMDIPTLLSDEANMGADKLYLLEQLQMRNNYRGHNTLGAGYLSISLPLGNFDINAGVRFEHNDMELISNSRDTEKSEFSRHYRNNDLFPSTNLTYKFDDKNQMRLSYGKSVNRPEFRELSSSVFYDFDLASNVQGNTELLNCYIHNVDLRYEFYPSRGEQISLAGFYKFFDSPIEWTYTVAGGTDLIYSYKNAKSAYSYGVELDVRKDLSNLGLPGLSWSFNGALIKSKVQFNDGDKEEDRPMQGQSPYLINTGFFYKNEPMQFDVALLYNVIGKRIIGVGRSEGTTASNENARVPDSYEMPRNVVDFTVSKKIKEHWELKFNVRDLLAQKVYYKQFAKVHYDNGTRSEIEQVTRSYKPGRNIGLQVVYKF